MATLQKITPNLWFDNQAEEAVTLYTSIFNSARVGRITRYGKKVLRFMAEKQEW